MQKGGTSECRQPVINLPCERCTALAMHRRTNVFLPGGKKHEQGRWEVDGQAAGHQAALDGAQPGLSSGV